MSFFPFYIDIEEKNVLIVGGGKVAIEKYNKIKEFTKNIIVVACKTSLAGDFVKKRAFEDDDLREIDICIVATSDRELNRRISGLCNERGILVNVVDDRELCSFIFPGIVKKGGLCIGISSSGASPSYVRYLRENIENMIPDNIEDILDKMDYFRKKVPETVYDQSSRARIYRELLIRLLEDADCDLDELSFWQV